MAKTELIDLDDLMGVSEIGAFFGVDPRTVSQWRQRGIFPEPDKVLEMGDLWLKVTMVEWGVRTHRIKED